MNFDVNYLLEPVFVVPFYNGWTAQISPMRARGDVQILVLPSWCAESMEKRVEIAKTFNARKWHDDGRFFVGVSEGEQLAAIMTKIASRPVEPRLAATLNKVGKGNA